MSYPIRSTLFALLLLCVAIARPVRAEEYHVIPYKADPPIQVDGNLDDWAGVPNSLILNRREQVTYTPENWTGPDDLSAVIRLAWREGGLFLAAEVTDDIVNQPYRAREIWKGDHLNLWVDMTPGQEPERKMFGAGQFHVVFSPGNLGGVAGDEELTPPEIYVYRPEGTVQEGGEIAARRTPTGYVIEAFLPWSRVGVTAPAMHDDANFEVAVSEADGSPARQESLMTIGTQPWVYSRDRLLPVVFGDGNGRGNPPVRGILIADRIEVPPGESRSLVFSPPPLPEGKEPYLFFKARFHAPLVSGVRERALCAEINGRRVAGGRISNRRAQSRFFDASLVTFVADDGAIGLYYADDWESPKRSDRFALMDYGPGCEYEFSLVGLLAAGENELRLVNMTQADDLHPHVAIVESVEFRVKSRAPQPAPSRPAPTGPLPAIEPQREFPRTWSNLRWNRSEVAFVVNGERFVVKSRFSAPDGKWHTGDTRFYRRTRTVVRHPEAIEVRDTFRNVSGGHVPIIQEHSCDLGQRLRSAWLGGYPVEGSSGRLADPSNPSAFAATQKAGIGLFAHNDEFIVHAEMDAHAGAICLADRSYVLEENGTYTSVLMIVPVPQPDFWAFVNQARRVRDVNFTLRWCFAFISQRWPIYYWSDEQFREFIDLKSANFVVLSNNLTRVDGRYPRCTEMYSADLTAYRDFMKKFRRLYPDGSVKVGHYYHCFLDTTPENATRFAADRALDEQGNHIDYGGSGSYMKAYIPTLARGGWGEEIAKWIDLILDDFKCDGIFWDEFTHSRASYVYNFWDRCSADIDPATFQIRKLKGSVTLLSLPFRYRLVRRILDRGCPLVINGAPATRTMVEQKFMAFTETGNMSNCREMLLYSPVALGDHLTERCEEDAYHDMLRALDHGCLYAWYTVRVFPTHRTLTQYMYPFTPVELHEGYVIGEERILTNRSGLFGWGDDSDIEAHVFDREGRETLEITPRRIVRDGKTYAEVRIPEGYSVALIRKRANPAPSDR